VKKQQEDMESSNVRKALDDAERARLLKLKKELERSKDANPSVFITNDLEELRIPTRIGNGIIKESKNSKKKPSSPSTEASTSPTTVTTTATTATEAAITAANEATWRAQEADFNSKRKDFHGVVTNLFGGVFCWQMYGSAEALDLFGNTYTEYLMRCSWGTNLDTLQPWIVSHRYREFDTLHADILKAFPSDVTKCLPALPKKDYLAVFSSKTVNPTVVAERRTALERYMSSLVTDFPQIMQSELLNSFLCIQERIATIQTKLQEQEAAVAVTTTVASK